MLLITTISSNTPQAVLDAFSTPEFGRHICDILDSTLGLDGTQAMPGKFAIGMPQKSIPASENCGLQLVLTGVITSQLELIQIRLLSDLLFLEAKNTLVLSLTKGDRDVQLFVSVELDRELTDANGQTSSSWSSGPAWVEYNEYFAPGGIVSLV